LGRRAHPLFDVRFLDIQDAGEQLPWHEGWMTVVVFVGEGEERELNFLNNLNNKMIWY